MKRNSILFFILLTLTFWESKAQNDTLTDRVLTNRCFSVEELEQLLHMPFREAYDMLDSKGYQMGFFFDKASGEYHDTIDGIVLTYSRMAFNDISDRKSAFWLYTSKDGLSNIVEWERSLPGSCTLFPLFHQKGYVYDRSNQIFHGSGIHNGALEHYEVQYFEDSLLLHMTMKNIREIDTFVTRRREAHEAEMLAKVEEVHLMALTDRYLPALSLLNSLKGNGHRVDSAVAVMRGYVLDQAEAYYFAKLDMVVNNSGDVNTGIQYCDTLLLFTRAQDSVRDIRTILQKQSDGAVNHYSELYPREYQELVKKLEKIVNDELSQNPLNDEQRLTMTFNILTRKENESSGKIRVGLSSMTFRNTAEPQNIRERKLQQSIDDLAHSGLIKPVRQHGIFLPTQDRLSADIRWKYYTMQVFDECNSSNQQLASAVKYIDDHFFSSFDTTRTSLSQQDGDIRVTGRVRKPTKRNYTFVINEKKMGDTYYTDISLTKFTTTGLLSWTPSLILPGLGTKKQGITASVGARAIPFFLCAALAVTGFVWENNGGKQVERTTFEDGGAARPWHYKDFGYYVGYGAGAIAATIYINELVEGISCSIRNLHRSKELRKRLKNGPVIVQIEKVSLQ